MCTNKRCISIGRVLENRKLCDEHFQLRLGLVEFPPARAGQFVQLQCRGLDEQACHLDRQWAPGEWPAPTQPELVGKEPMLRRPLSLANCRRVSTSAEGVGVEMELIYRTIGTGTSWLGTIDIGMEISVLGPLGNGFPVKPGQKQAALIGGGVGIPPMLFLARALRDAGTEVVAFCGARSARLLPLTVAANTPPSPAGKPLLCVEEFTRLGVKTIVATDDASVGVGGTVTEAFRHYLNAHVPAPGDLTVYSCGPEPMMRAVADLCLARDYTCYLALERHMACGMGTCQSCIVKLHDTTHDRGWSVKLCCTDGPVFDARDLVW